MFYKTKTTLVTSSGKMIVSYNARQSLESAKKHCIEECTEMINEHDREYPEAMFGTYQEATYPKGGFYEIFSNSFGHMIESYVYV